MAPQTPFTVAAVHAASEFLDLDASVEKACRLIEEAGAAGARLVVFPESFLPGYPFWIGRTRRPRARRCSPKLFGESVELPSDATRRIGQAARRARTWVCIGINERDGGTLYNTLAWFDDDGRSRRPPPQAAADERGAHDLGPRRRARRLRARHAAGRLGGLICFEHSMDLNRYALIALGQQVHVGGLARDLGDDGRFRTRATSTTSPRRRSSTTRWRAQAYVICAQSRHRRGRDRRDRPHGQPDKIRVGGGLSAIVAPDASYVSGPHRDDEAILYGEIDLGIIPFAKFFADSAGHYARPDVFSFGIDGRAQTPITGAPDGAVDHWHVIGTPDDTAEIVDGDTEPRLLAPPNAG